MSAAQTLAPLLTPVPVAPVPLCVCVCVCMYMVEEMMVASNHHLLHTPCMFSIQILHAAHADAHAYAYAHAYPSLSLPTHVYLCRSMRVSSHRHKRTQVRGVRDDLSTNITLAWPLQARRTVYVCKETYGTVLHLQVHLCAVFVCAAGVYTFTLVQRALGKKKGCWMTKSLAKKAT